jgi:hypothetical protein
MLIAATKPLFAWDGLEDCPSLKTIRELLASHNLWLPLAHRTLAGSRHPDYGLPTAVMPQLRVAGFSFHSPIFLLTGPLSHSIRLLAIS